MKTQAHEIYMTWTGVITTSAIANKGYTRRRQYYTDKRRTLRILIYVEKGTNMTPTRWDRLNAAVLWHVANEKICSPGELELVDPKAPKRGGDNSGNMNRLF